MRLAAKNETPRRDKDRMNHEDLRYLPRPDQVAAVPGDEPPHLKAVHRMKNGESYNLSRLETSMHAGTHVDAPLHFIADGKDIASLPPERFIGECVVLTVPRTR